jgi:hypothetical protein
VLRSKELPAFESIEEFKVGDRVRFYSAYKNRVGKITEIRPEEGQLIILCGRDTVVSPHFKACRKLEPAQRQEGWVWSGDVGLAGSRPLWPEKHPMDTEGEWILFREVLDE